MNIPDAEAAARLGQRVETAAQDVVMLERRNLPAMAKMAKALKEISRDAEACAKIDAALTPCVAAAAAAGTLLERIILQESPDPARHFDIVVQTVSSLQSIICLAHPADFPPEVCGSVATAPAAAAGSVPAASQPNTGVVAPSMDDDLFQAFVAQQQSVLPDIEDTILAYETDGAAEHLASLRRMIHTMKGESGVCGVTDIAKVCHVIEDYVECPQGVVAKDLISADVLFSAKDWLERAVKAYAHGEPPIAMDELLPKLARTSSKQSAPALASQAKTAPAAEAAAPRRKSRLLQSPFIAIMPRIIARFQSCFLSSSSPGRNHTGPGSACARTDLSRLA